MLPSNQEREWCHCTAGYDVIKIIIWRLSFCAECSSKPRNLFVDDRRQTILSCRNIKTWGVVDCFYIALALFSVLEQTHCALFAYDSKWVTVAFYSALSGLVAALFGSYMAGATQNFCHLGEFCVHHPTMLHITSLRPSVYTIQLCFISRHFVRLCTRQRSVYICVRYRTDSWQMSINNYYTCMN